MRRTATNQCSVITKLTGRGDEVTLKRCVMYNESVKSFSCVTDDIICDLTNQCCMRIR